MKIMLAASAFALSIAPASGQSVASPQTPTPVVAPAAAPAPRPPVHRIRAKRAMSPVVARVAAANRAATQEPLRQAFVNAVQVFPFSDGAIYQVYTAPGAVTDISLQPGESLVAVAAGDTVRWIIGDTTSGSGAQKRTHILVKPFASGLATNLVITTDRRSYHLQLTATSRTAMAALSWTYPADQLIALRRAADQAAAAELSRTGCRSTICISTIRSAETGRHGGHFAHSTTVGRRSSSSRQASRWVKRRRSSSSAPPARPNSSTIAFAVDIMWSIASSKPPS